MPQTAKYDHPHEKWNLNVYMKYILYFNIAENLYFKCAKMYLESILFIYLLHHFFFLLTAVLRCYMLYDFYIYLDQIHLLFILIKLY